MKRKLLNLMFALFAGTLLCSAQVVFDPASYPPGDLGAGMSIVDIDGEAYLQVVLDGYNDYVYLPEIAVRPGLTASAEIKFILGPNSIDSAWTLSNIQAVVQLQDTIDKMPAPWDASTLIDAMTQITQGTVTGEFATNTGAPATQMKLLHQMQIYGQYKGGSYPATFGDTIWVGAVSLLPVEVAKKPEAITIETFGETLYGTGSADNGKKIWGPADTLRGWHNTEFCTWTWDSVTTFTSENGQIESGSDSSVRIVEYVNRKDLLLTNNAGYAGSWDTVIFKGINISAYNVTSVDFEYAKNTNKFINADTACINAKYSIDGGAWVNLDTSLIPSFADAIWKSISLPVNKQGTTMDVMLYGLNTTQAIIDDLSVLGTTLAPDLSMPIANIVAGTVDNATDFSAEAALEWDTDSIYMAITVTDDSIVTKGTNYVVDNIEIYFDMDNSKNIHWPRNGGWVSGDATYDTNDYQFRIVPNDTLTWLEMSDNDSIPAYMKLTLTPTGYEYIVDIAWDDLLDGFKAVPYQQIGFDILISDNDDAAKTTASDNDRNQITLNAPTQMPWNDPSLFGVIEFEGSGYFHKIMVDNEAPAVPANFKAALDTVTGDVTLTWDPAKDNIAVMTYLVNNFTKPNDTLLYALETGNKYTFKGLDTGNYLFTVMTIDNYGNSSDYGRVSIKVVKPTVSIETIAADNSFEIFPNPATDVLNIRNSSPISEVQIMGINGSILRIEKFNNVNELSLNASDLSSGLYLIKITDAEGAVKINKVIIK